MNRAITHVYQQDRSGCGIACAAMIAGVDYATARAAWVGYSRKRERRLYTLGAGLTRDEINALLIRLKWCRGTFYFRRYLHLVNVQPGIGGHWVVTDGWYRTFDPAT